MADFTVQRVVQPLAKVEPALAEHLKALRTAARGQPDSARYIEAERAIRKKLFSDSMVPGVGNKLAWEDFASRPREGVHVMLDANDFGSINKRWGQSTGDGALKAMGEALSRAGRTNRGKLFRVGGDEFRAHFDTPEQAHSFVRHARQELEQLPSVGGVHRHSVSVGLASSPEEAEQALIHAKNAKKAAGYVEGQAQTHVHSLLPGAVGAVPLAPAADMPAGLKLRKPGQSPLPLPDANKPVQPQPMQFSEKPLTVIHDNPAQPVPVYYLGNDAGLMSADGSAFLKSEDLLASCPNLDELRAQGFVPRTYWARKVKLGVDGEVWFE